MKDTYHIGQLVRITHSSVGHRDHRIYCIVCLDGDETGDRLYRVKNAVGIECLVKADEIEPAALTALP